MDSTDAEEVESGSLGTDWLCGFNSGILVRLSARKGLSQLSGRKRGGDEGSESVRLHK